MAKRGYKLQDFVAHPTNVSCLCIAKKACRLFITGGDDHKINFWAIGNPTSLMSLCGHASPVKSLPFHTSETLVLSGSSTGSIKLWDLEEAKMVHTFTGHGAAGMAVQFHPFGEFFASGSMDTNLKIWDLRQKGCLRTYEGHTQGISAIRFTPDGRWVVSGGYDNVVKVWDLTAGKLLHDFRFHNGYIRCLDFHPFEFVLATGSADRTVKFWDLETFELIGSTRPEATGVCNIAFHPDGRTIFCGLDDHLKVYSWEPVICHDTVDMGWSTLADLCVADGKVLGCSYHRNTVGVWVANLSVIEPCGAVPEESGCNEHKVNVSLTESSSGSHSRTPDDDSIDIKDIYVDTAGTNIEGPQRFGSLKKHVKFLRIKLGTPIQPAHMRKQSISKNNLDKPSALEPGASNDGITEKEMLTDFSLNIRNVSEDRTPKYHEEKFSEVKSVPIKLGKVVSPEKTYNHGTFSVLSGRTRSLVERFERQERSGCEHVATDSRKHVVPKTSMTSPFVPENVASSIITHTVLQNELEIEKKHPVANCTSFLTTTSKKSSLSINTSSPVIPEENKTTNLIPVTEITPSVIKEVPHAANCRDITKELLQANDVFLNSLKSRLTKLQVVGHFWKQNDIKGAIGAMRKLPDHFVQADVMSILLEKTEVLTLDLFSRLLPMLVDLLDSNFERHVKVSLDMLLKLVIIFGPVIHATISAPPTPGVDLRAEERRECCNQCHLEIRKIQRILPKLIRKGGVLAKCAEDLSLVLLES